MMVAMVLLTVGNMVMRILPGVRPFGGTAEMVGFLAALIAAFALGYTQLQKAHTRVELVVSRLSSRTQSIVYSIFYPIGMALFGIATWRLVVLGNHFWEIGSLSDTMRIIFYPFIYAVALGCASLCLVLLLDFLNSLSQAVKK